MTKKILALCALSLALFGCQQFQETAQNLRKQGESTYGTLSQQADQTKTQLIQTKDKFDEKSQQFVNAADAVGKLTK